jgi:hypothetical protein
MNLLSDSIGKWDLSLSHVECSYNNSINRSIGKTPFKNIYGRLLSGITDWLKLNVNTLKSEDAKICAKYMKVIYD